MPAVCKAGKTAACPEEKRAAEEPVARGIALGTSGHAVGTAKAAELGETEGAMSGLAIATAGLISVLLITVTAELLPIL